MMRSANGFPQRQNRDGSYDSICPRCFLTVAKGLSPRELDVEERIHICSPIDLATIRVAKDDISIDA
jgi:hypothetical protein